MKQPNAGRQAALKKLRRIDPNVEVRWDLKTGGVARLRGLLAPAAAGDAETVARGFLGDHKNLFGLKHRVQDLRLKRVGSDGADNRHVKFQQMHGGIPVFGHELVVHLDAEGRVRGTSGHFAPDIAASVKPKLTADAAVENALAHEKGNRTLRGVQPTLLVLVREGKANLAWLVTVAGEEEWRPGRKVPAHWVYFIDALSGDVIWRYNNLQTHGPAVGTGTGKYSGAGSLNTFHNHRTGAWALRDDTLPTAARVETHDANGGTAPGSGSPVATDADNAWSAAGQAEEVDCHRYTRTAYDYFYATHGRDSYDDAGADLFVRARVHIHHGNDLTNNSCWCPTYQQVFIGQHDDVDFQEMCTLDIIAHEWTHAVTEHTAGLVYADESGAVNESLSDVFACLIDGNWLIGEQCWLNTTSAPASRNLADPTNGGSYDPANPVNSVLAGHQPDHISDKYTGIWDNGGVHCNSGIMNKAAWLIAEGGSHRGVSICAALGRDRLGALYYQALTNHLTASSDFQDTRDAVVDSVHDLYSGNTHYNRWRVSVNNAFAAVGVGTAEACPSVCYFGPLVCGLGPTHCPPAPDVFICPPSPMVCRAAPHVCALGPVCQLGPIQRCPPAPDLVQCRVGPLGPVGCLPGPDPLPYKPELEIPTKLVRSRRRQPRQPIPKAKTSKPRSRG